MLNMWPQKPLKPLTFPLPLLIAFSKDLPPFHTYFQTTLGYPSIRSRFHQQFKDLYSLFLGLRFKSHGWHSSATTNQSELTFSVNTLPFDAPRKMHLLT